MKRLLPILLLFACVVTRADLLTVTISITNRTQVGQSFTNSSRIVFWTNNPLNSVNYLTTNNPSISATSLARYFGAQFPGYVTRQTNSTNVIITGNNLQLGISSGWATITTNTSTASNGWFVTLPFSNQVDTNRTKTASELVSGIGLYSTNAFPTNATALSNHLSLGPQTQTFSNKISLNNTQVNNLSTNLLATNSTFGGGTLSGRISNAGTITGGSYSNSTLVFATGTTKDTYQTNVIADRLTATNFSAPGSGANSTQIGPGSDASGDYSVAVGLNNIAGGLASTAIGGANEATGDFSTALGSGNQAQGDWTFAGGEGSVASGNTSFAFGAAASAAHDLTFVFGSAISSDYAGQAKFGTDLYVTGFMRAEGGYSNNVFKGTNVINGRLDITSGSRSLAAGYNAATILGSNAVISLSAASVSTNAGFAAPGGEALYYVEVSNPNRNYSILHDSGLDSAANRVLTGHTNVGAVVNFTNDPATFWIRYNTSAGRYVLGPRSY